MHSKQFQEEVRALYKTYFPNGYINISKLHMGNGCYIRCGLIDDINDVQSKIRENDPMTVRAFIHDGFKFNDDTTELDNVVIEFDGAWISVLPDNPHHYSQSHKVSTRKINGDVGKALLNLSKFFQRLRNTVKEQAAANRIIKQDSIDPKYL